MNEKNEFDKLIKEKAEKKEFKYKPWMWLLFLRKTGMAIFSLTEVITISTVIGGLLVGGTYLTIKNFHHKTEKIFPNAIPMEFIADSIPAKDTCALVQPNASSSPQLEKTPTANSPKNAKSSVKTEQSVPSQPAKIDTVPAKKQQPKSQKKSEKWKYLEINPDTIKTNY